MIFIRKSNDRGRSQTKWLSSFHTFSFAGYYDPKFIEFGHLRVINEDTVQPGFGFEKHPHSNMEIISYVVEGSLEHRDSIGNGSVIKPGELQIMTAGTGIEHSEFNHSQMDLLHFLQIWIVPEKTNLTPSYQQITINKVLNQFVLIGSQNKQDGTVIIHQDVNLYVAFLTRNISIDYSLKANRKGWLQLVKGKIKLNNQTLLVGDGAAIQNEKINLQCIEDSELLFFDLSSN